jgi:hypothetical protein
MTWGQATCEKKGDRLLFPYELSTRSDSPIFSRKSSLSPFYAFFIKTFESFKDN